MSKLRIGQRRRESGMEFACRVADEAMKLLRRPSGWTQGAFFKEKVVTRKGESTAITAYCMMGAIRSAEAKLVKGGPPYTAALYAETARGMNAEQVGRVLVRHVLANAIRAERGQEPTPHPEPHRDESVITSYNDASKRKKKEVIERFEDLRGEVCK